MKDDHTELGGPQRDFPLTTANFRDQLGHATPEAKQAVLQTLAQRYWKPVYHYLRRVTSKTNEDAKDLTQAFFMWILERDLLLKYDSKRAGFRSYLKGVLRNFAGNEHQALQRLKRGGGVKFVPLDIDSADNPRIETDPDKLFDQAWTQAIVARAIERVRARYESSGRLVPFLVFRQYDLASADKPPTYAQIATRLGIKEGDVRNHLFEVRDKIRAEARSEFAATGDPEPTDEEWAGLL